MKSNKFQLLSFFLFLANAFLVFNLTRAHSLPQPLFQPLITSFSISDNLDLNFPQPRSEILTTSSSISYDLVLRVLPDFVPSA